MSLFDKVNQFYDGISSKKKGGIAIHHHLHHQDGLAEHVFCSKLSHKEVSLIKRYAHETILPEGKSCFSEENGHDKIYLILEGKILVRNKNGDTLAKPEIYGHGDIVNGLALAEDSPPVVSAVAVTPTHLIVIDPTDIKKNASLAEIRSKLLATLSGHIHKRLHHTEAVFEHTNKLAVKSLEAQLETSKMRVESGKFVLRLIIFMSIYTLSLKWLGDFGSDPITLSIISISMLFIIAIYTLSSMLSSKAHTMKEFGFSIDRWPKMLLETILVTTILCIVPTYYKIYMINSIDYLSTLPLYQWTTGIEDWKITDPETFIFMIAYIIFSPVQEFVVRGGVQTSLYDFFGGGIIKRAASSIIVSNLLFMTFHSHLSFMFALATIMPGIIWGILFYRHRSLIGVSISHIVTGVYTLFILDFHQIMIV